MKTRWWSELRRKPRLPWWGKRFYVLCSLAITALLAIPIGIALADQAVIANRLAISGDNTVAPGTSGQAQVLLVPDLPPVPPGDPAECDATESEPAKATATVSGDNSNALDIPNPEVSITNCASVFRIPYTVKSDATDGTLTLTVTITGGRSGSQWFNNPTSFHIDVKNPTQPTQDSTAPNITPNVVGTLGKNGWYTSNVAVSWNTTDDESPITSSSGCGMSTVSSDTSASGKTLTCTATSAGGTATKSVTIYRNATAPTATATPDRSPDHNGWYNHAVTFKYDGTDDTSGIDSCDNSASYSGPDGSKVSPPSGYCYDKAGNKSAAATYKPYNSSDPTTFDYDATKPTLSPSVSPNPVLLNGTATASVNATDATSDIESHSGTHKG